MNDELREMSEPATPATAAADSGGKPGFPRIYLLFGVIGILVIALAITTTALLMGGEPTPSESASSDSAVVAEVPQTTQTATPGHGEQAVSPEPYTEPDIPDFEPFDPITIKDDSGVLGDIMANLEFLDYDPEVTADELSGESEGMSKEDSIEAAQWIQQETDRLAKKEEELNARQRELEILDKKVSQKILRIEQAESARVTDLAKLYDGMDPRSVAKLVANLDDETVVSILPRMKQKNASQVLSLMPAVRAAKLSKQMITIAEN
ncbi:MAG: hypothetical protein RBT76_00985 [candidate division Zixibacteria bacterium]|nr:hypothetical protein [candidate division Zixibacteria bacterium]